MKYFRSTTQKKEATAWTKMRTRDYCAWEGNVKPAILDMQSLGPHDCGLGRARLDITDTLQTLIPQIPEIVKLKQPPTLNNEISDTRERQAAGLREVVLFFDAPGS